MTIHDRDRELRHEVLAEQLAAYADQEVAPETAAQIDAHLLGCDRCRRELMVQIAIRERLAAESISPVSAPLSARITAAIADLPRDPNAPLLPVARSDAAPNAETSRWHRLGVTWSGWAVAAGLAMLLLGRIGVPTEPAERQPVVESPATLAAIWTPIPMVDDAVANYRTVMAGELPGTARDLDTVRSALPFPLEPIAGSEVRLLAAWTTMIRGEPAAALAYRWGDLVIVQYVVSEELFFRNPVVRQAVAARRGFVTVRGSQSVIGWPESVGGTLLVGDGSPETLAKVRQIAGRRRSAASE
jgi:anti-sigma factor RsiW